MTSAASERAAHKRINTGAPPAPPHSPAAALTERTCDKTETANLNQTSVMVVKMETVAALDVYPAKAEYDCSRRQKARKTLPALVEDDSEPEYEEEQPRSPLMMRADQLRRQHSVSPPRRQRANRLVLPSLSEDEEP
ncbi:unnamed protein product [Plutella xylostella]|uniref:(diamondback moth) hypothetical protein n=1 Tax=Plutella xylostella TaxID=51655 RepID=A0A8S4FJY2_PLUXY|nr:unnamed protein product [Plutella xylostella]